VATSTQTSLLPTFCRRPPATCSFFSWLRSRSHKSCVLEGLGRQGDSSASMRPSCSPMICPRSSRMRRRRTRGARRRTARERGRFLNSRPCGPERTS
jgi:hypothetical protein